MATYKYTNTAGKTLWYASFYAEDWTGERRRIVKRGFKTQREAKDYERSYLDRQKSSSDMLFSSLVANYMEDMSHRLKPTTFETKSYIINDKVLPYFGRLKVWEITPDRVRKWQNKLMSHRDEKGKGYSQTYLKTVNNQLSAIFNYAVANYGLRANPCHAAGAMGKSKAGEMNIWTKEEFEQFIKCERRSAFKVAFDTLFYTGIRVGELLALTPSDITPEHRLRICKSFSILKTGEHIITEPKTEKSKREVALPAFLYDELMEYVGRLYGIQPGDQIFYFTKSGLTTEFKRITAEAGLPEIRLHDLRHSHASMLIDMGFQPLDIANRLGHESIKTTLDTYAHLYPNKDFDLADAIDQIGRTDPENKS